MRRAAACCCVIILGCTSDIRLGDLPGSESSPLPDAGSAPSDAALDAGALDAGAPDATPRDSGPWVPPRPLPPDGRYRLSYLPGVVVRCQGFDPFGFSTMTSTQAGLHEGVIEIAQRATVLEVSGPPILAGFGLQTLRLTQTATEGVHLGAVARSAAGPADSKAVEGRMRMDIEVPAPLPPETEAQVRYEAMPDGDWCELTFRAVLTRQDGG